jgi:tetratricopeptide (TPR) repeat protein
MFSFKSKAERLQDEGILFGERGHYDEAIKYLQQALEIEPENGVFRYNLGLTHTKSSDIQRALEEFKLSIRFKPDHADSYFAIATGIFPQGPDWKAAIFYMAYLDFSKHGEMARTAQKRLAELGREALAFDIKQWQDSAEIGYEHFVMGMGNMGAKFGHTISQQKPETEDVIVSGLQNYFSDVAPSKAMEWAGPHFKNGVELTVKGKYRAAIAQLITGLDILPHDQPAMCALASAYAFAGDSKQASEILNLIKIEKVDSDTRQFMANQVKELKDYIHSHSSYSRQRT